MSKYVPRISLQSKRGQAVRNRIIKYVNETNCKIVVSTSGGKDSAALLVWACQQFGNHNVHALHAELDTDWNETIPTVIAQCKHANVKLSIVKRDDGKGMLDLLIAGQRDRKTKEMKEKKWPGSGTQWCTSQLKITPLDKWCKEYGDNVIVLIGERAEESIKRACKDVWSKKHFPQLGKTLVKCSPIYDWSIEKVWSCNEFHDMPKHPIYALGVSRASCGICIYSRKCEIAIAAKHNPQLVNRYLNAEKKIKHTFKPKQSIADILIEQGIQLNENGEVG